MALRRTAVGIDLGTTDVIAANVGRKGVEIVQNAVSERRTPALVSFTDRRRLLGDAALPQVRSNFRNSCRGLKHLVGRAVGSPELELERLWSLCPLGLADDGNVGFEVSYRGQEKCVSATACLAMLITAIVATCKAWTKMEISEVVLAIPSYLTGRHRQFLLDAMHIAGVNCLRLVHEATAMAFAWRFDRRDLEDATPIHVAFCSAGHSALLVAVVRFHRGAVAILSEAYELAVSGRAMDRLLMEVFAESLQKQGAPDPLGLVKACLKLEDAATKVKKTLSSVDEARATAECVVEDYDLTCDVKRSKFEKLCCPMYDKVKATVEHALSHASLQAADLTHVEVLGGACRVPWVQRALREAFGGRELSTTLNADEAVAKGSAWQAAMLSPLIRLNHLPLQECNQWAVALEWEDSLDVEAEAAETREGGTRRLLVFEARAGSHVETVVALKCRGPLRVEAVCVCEESTAGHMPAEVNLGSWNLSFPKSRQMQDVEVNCSLDMNCIFSISQAAVCTGEKDAAAKVAEAAVHPATGASAQDLVAKETTADEASLATDKAAVTVPPTQEGSRNAAPTDEKATAQPQAEDGEKAQQPETEKPAELVQEEQLHDQQQAEGKTTEVDGNAAGSNQGGAVNGKAAEEPETQEPEDPFAEAPLQGSNSTSGRFAFLPTWRFWRWGRGDNNGKQAAQCENSAGPQQRRRVGGASKGGRKEETEVQKAAVAALHRPGYSKDALRAALKAELSFRAADEAAVRAENSRNDYETFLFALRTRMAGGPAPHFEFASSEERRLLAEDVDAAEAWIYEHTEEEANVYSERLRALKKRENEFSNRMATSDAIQEKAKALKANIRKFKASAASPNYNHIAKEKLDSVISECDSATQWLSELEAHQKDVHKWEAPVMSVSEISLRANALVKNSTAILSEPKPKPPDPPSKKDKKDKKKGKDGGKSETDASKKEPAGDAKSEELPEEAKSEVEPAPTAAVEPTKPEAARARNLRWVTVAAILGFLLAATAVWATGLGDSLGLPAPPACFAATFTGSGEDEVEADSPAPQHDMQSSDKTQEAEAGSSAPRRDLRPIEDPEAEANSSAPRRDLRPDEEPHEADAASCKNDGGSGVGCS
mmetsp:Transcript_6729/g.12543  ORF Transcript_6729/g.12543 Transcript_6729/m.12543 type:complete len:1114 (+) Transcript_6729:56-3397(+)